MHSNDLKKQPATTHRRYVWFFRSNLSCNIFYSFSNSITPNTDFCLRVWTYARLEVLYRLSDLTSDLKEEAIPSSEWSRWELQPSEKSQESPAASQRLSIATSLNWSSPESVLAPCQLRISGEFLSFSSVNFQKWLSFLQRRKGLLWSQLL